MYSLEPLFPVSIHLWINLMRQPRYDLIWQSHILQVGPIAEQSKSSDLDCGWGDPGSNPGGCMYFFRDGELSGSHIACFQTW